ncbi:hypothetical protein CRG98_016133, partial [Punica granatum]
MGGIWNVFCGESECRDPDGGACYPDFMSIIVPSSCANNALVFCFNILISVVFLLAIITKSSSSKYVHASSRYRGFSRLQIASAVFNGFLGLTYLCFGTWVLEEKLRKTRTALPLDRWLVVLLQGIVWLLVSLVVSLRRNRFSRTPLRLMAILAFLFASILCFLSLSAAVLTKNLSVKIVLDILSFPGAFLLLLSAYKGAIVNANESDLYAPLNGEAGVIEETDKTGEVTTFARAGLFSRMTFWWLNGLMRRGRQKTLEDEDIPKLREVDRAESCYQSFLEECNKQKNEKPSVLWTIMLCNWRDILISGFFALLKILTISAGPLLLNAFIEVAEGKEWFPYEGYLLAISLFFSKSLESLSQRQWYFRSRLIGIKVRSLLSAAIYKKQLRLSNSARLVHSGSEIMNYVTVDAYRIGEFPFWFHQTWTTSLQLCIALMILFRAVGPATIASLLVIILTVLCNTPLAKLQHKFQSKLMVAQDERLKASSEALVNMKVLKLYAWEIHFKSMIENLRKIEEKWLSAVQLRKAYNSFLFWSSPVLVSAATFGACYFLKIPLHASNVFTFVATLRLVQDPIRSIPDVIGIVIQANVAFTRIVKFLEAPELQSGKVRRKSSLKPGAHIVSIESANFSWEENSQIPTIRNISLKVRPGEKVAICGEVGSGKSTLLAAILGEVPNTRGTIEVHGRIAYVSQTAWIQTGSIQENILFGSPMDSQRYRHTLESCSLDYVMGALSDKTVFLVTHQVDFLPTFDSVLLMSDGKILQAAPFDHLLASSTEFQELVHAHEETAGSERLAEVTSSAKQEKPTKEIKKSFTEKQQPKKPSKGDGQLIKQEERETGDTGFKPYLQYLNQNKGYLFFTTASLGHLMFVIGQILQNSWMAANVENPQVSTLKLIVVYLSIGVTSTLFLMCRSLSTVILGLQSSRSLFSQLLDSLFRAPMSFYDSTPLGRILSR